MDNRRQPESWIVQRQSEVNGEQQSYMCNQTERTLIGRWMLLIAAIIKSAIVEGDTKFVESRWGGYLIDMYEAYRENEDRRFMPTEVVS